MIEKKQREKVRKLGFRISFFHPKVSWELPGVSSHATFGDQTTLASLPYRVPYDRKIGKEYLMLAVRVWVIPRVLVLPLPYSSS